MHFYWFLPRILLCVKSMTLYTTTILLLRFFFGDIQIELHIHARTIALQIAKELSRGKNSVQGKIVFRKNCNGGNIVSGKNCTGKKLSSKRLSLKDWGKIVFEKNSPGKKLSQGKNFRGKIVFGMN